LDSLFVEIASLNLLLVEAPANCIFGLLCQLVICLRASGDRLQFLFDLLIQGTYLSLYLLQVAVVRPIGCGHVGKTDLQLAP